MDRRRPHVGAESEVLLESDGRARVARYLALEREKQELRRERDHLVLDLAAGLGEAGLSQQLGLTASATTRLLEGARERLGGGAGEHDCATREINARRGHRGQSRWVAADAHYEALGRAASSR